MTDFDNAVDKVRDFTRFYTKKAGVLNELLLNSNYGLTEARILHELNALGQTTAKHLVAELELDPAYVSRVLKKFEKSGLVARTQSAKDKRLQVIALTGCGENEYLALNEKSAQLFGNLLEDLNLLDQSKLLSAMDEIQALLGRQDENAQAYQLRSHRPGDMGWIVGAHGRLYSEEYGWDDTFEAMVAKIAAEFIENFDPKSECCWIAERAGQTIGSAMVVKENEATAKLRLVIVDPDARDLGVGVKLVEECINFSRRTGYSEMTLWTNDNLHAAIGIYKKLGFKLVDEEPHHSFGADLVGQYWQLDL